MRLSEIAKGYKIFGPKDRLITGVTASSKQVVLGNLFLAKKGGEAYIQEAIHAGASAIATSVYDPFIPVPQIIDADIDALEQELGKRFYKAPSKKLSLIGITGTSGKTTSTYLLHHLLPNCGLISTVEWKTGQHSFEATHTTPDLLTNQKLLRDMVESQRAHCAMEVSSHALDQGRVRDLSFAGALFTNFSHEHLDYHKTLEAYGEAKRKLFTMLPKEAWAVINIDDPFSETIKTNAHLLTYGLSSKASVRAEKIMSTTKGLVFTLCFEGKKYQVKAPLIGEFNVYNLLGAIAVCLTRGMPLEEIIDKIATFSEVPGRLSRVKNPLGLHIYVDYAHKVEALASVIRVLTPLKKGKLITLFGCGGERDREKRNMMGQIATRLSDQVIITSDNPRGEDPAAIIKEILSGCEDKTKVLVEPDRKKAIEKAIALATKDDIILIAGKGHEKRQIFAHESIPFDDQEVARQACLK